MFEVSEKTGHIRTARAQYTLGMAYKVYVQVRHYILHKCNSLANLQAIDKRGQASDVAVVDIVCGTRSPQFMEPSYHATVPENSPVHATLAFCTDSLCNFSLCRVAHIQAQSFARPPRPIRMQLYDDQGCIHSFSSEATNKTQVVNCASRSTSASIHMTVSCVSCNSSTTMANLRRRSSTCEVCF